MNKALRIVLIVLGSLAVVGGSVFAGTWLGARYVNRAGIKQPIYGMMNGNNRPGRAGGFGMVGGGRADGYGMVGGGRGSGPSMMGGGRGSGGGMMGDGYGFNNNTSATPLTVDQAKQAATKYLTALNIADLKIAEVMVFNNNAYVRVVETSSGIGAFELLVEPVSLAVFPERGPNMMWNLKYGGMSMMGGHGGMMGNLSFSSTPATVSATMPVTSKQALEAAQKYLDTALPGAKTATNADAFYGYYTIDILQNGKITGMLSVNGFSGQVFVHTWHGTFVATQDYK
jgi:hypothetical protein